MQHETQKQELTQKNNGWTGICQLFREDMNGIECYMRTDKSKWDLVMVILAMHMYHNVHSKI